MGGGSLALVQAIVESVEENPNKLQALVKMFLQKDETISVPKWIRKELELTKSSDQLSATVYGQHISPSNIC